MNDSGWSGCVAAVLDLQAATPSQDRSVNPALPRGECVTCRDADGPLRGVGRGDVRGRRYVEVAVDVGYVVVHLREKERAEP